MQAGRCLFLGTDLGYLYTAFARGFFFIAIRSIAADALVSILTVVFVTLFFVIQIVYCSSSSLPSSKMSLLPEILQLKE